MKYEFKDGRVIRPSGKPLDTLCHECRKQMTMASLTTCDKLICEDCRRQIEKGEGMIYQFHAYQCNSCCALFAGEDHEDLNHADIVCPFCEHDDIEDAGHFQTKLDT